MDLKLTSLCIVSTIVFAVATYFSLRKADKGEFFARAPILLSCVSLPLYAAVFVLPMQPRHCLKTYWVIRYGPTTSTCSVRRYRQKRNLAFGMMVGTGQGRIFLGNDRRGCLSDSEPLDGSI